MEEDVEGKSGHDWKSIHFCFLGMDLRQILDYELIFSDFIYHISNLLFTKKP